MADAMEAPGQYVQQEWPDELMRMQPHRLPARRAVGAVVLPAERDAGVVGCNEAAIRDGGTMGVTGEIAQHLFGSRKRRLAIDHPLDVPQRGDEALECALVSEPGLRVEELQLAGAVPSMSIASILPRNRRASTLTCTRKLEREETHRAPSNESPPPGTIMCTCG